MTAKGLRVIERRDFLALAAAGVLRAAAPITRPAVSETACPLERATPSRRTAIAGSRSCVRRGGRGRFRQP